MKHLRQMLTDVICDKNDSRFYKSDADLGLVSEENPLPGEGSRPETGPSALPILPPQKLNTEKPKPKAKGKVIAKGSSDSDDSDDDSASG